jgi:hypothetical protein
MASPIRRRVAATVTCIALAFATFGYMQRNAFEAAHEAPPAVECDQAKHDRSLGCLTLFEN